MQRPYTALGNATQNALSKPEFIRLPASGSKDPITGLSRSTLNSVILPCAANEYKPPVKSIALRKPGSARGIRLIHLDSLLEYIKSQGDDGTEAAK